MERPQARIVDQQHVESEREVTGWEAEQLLRKYGYNQPQQFTTRENSPQVESQPGLTFDEMIAQEESKRKAEQQRRMAQVNGPKPITFEGRNGYDTEVKYSSDDESGFGFKVEITTDMKLPKY